MSTQEIAVAETYGRTLVELGETNDSIAVLEADLMKASGTMVFQDRFPDRTFQVGVAEQNMMGLAAGLAVEGMTPFASTFAVFATKRACDQVSVSIAYPRLNVKVVGTYCGLSVPYGATHQSVQDIAIMRTMPNMVVISPADTVELAAAMNAIAAYDGPVYLRTERGSMPKLLAEDHAFTIGSASILAEGDDATIVGTGIMTGKALEAAAALARDGIAVRVLNMSTIKPLDEEAIVAAARETGFIVTVENHSIMGGLGSAVCEVIAATCPVPVKRVGIDDAFGLTGPFEWSRQHFEFDVPHIVAAVKEGLKS